MIKLLYKQYYIQEAVIMNKNKDPFKTSITHYSFNAISQIEQETFGVDCPIVYILSGEKEAYIGETQSAYDRMLQHRRNIRRNTLSKISLISSDSFNKSAILDVENMLITHMHADGKFILQNSNGGQSRLHKYYQRTIYRGRFEQIWNQLKKDKLVVHSLFEVTNSEIFKYSPYKTLTIDQYNIAENLLKDYEKAMRENKKINIIIKGGAGTGKSLVAIHFINTIVNILNDNYDIQNPNESFDSNSLNEKAECINNIKKYGNNKIAFVVPVPAFRDTVKKVFKSINAFAEKINLTPYILLNSEKWEF